jgi:hypothetical protein
MSLFTRDRCVQRKDMEVLKVDNIQSVYSVYVLFGERVTGGAKECGTIANLNVFDGCCLVSRRIEEYQSMGCFRP